MKPNEPSRTALMVARQRAAHQVLDQGSILRDPFAMRILGEDEKDVVAFARQHPLASLGRLFTAARSRLAEDALAEAVGRGVRQIVILGAGLDTFGLRNPHSSQPVHVFEVDYPATQAWKRGRLAAAQIAVPAWLHFVPVDFERDDPGHALAGAGFQPNAPAFFTWLGVVPYLTRHAVEGSLAWMATVPEAEVVLDYLEPPETLSEEVRRIDEERADHLKRIDERSASRFSPEEMAAILLEQGFYAVEEIGFEQIRSRFGGGMQGLAAGHVGLHVVQARRHDKG